MKEIQPRYPVYVISKGRSGCCLTAQSMEKDSVLFHLVIELQEEDEYARRHDRDRLCVLPFSNLGEGSIPARNWVWEHAKADGHSRHWIIDDNINGMYRRFKTGRIWSRWGVALRVAEDFTDRYENIAIAGFNYGKFVPDKHKFPPFVSNTHVYSCLLIRNDLNLRWRGRYNEDTDLCLQVLSEGWCTILINAFLINKMSTMTMKGGNTDDLYEGDGRLEMARSLERMWPGVVSIKRQFKRPQHKINWRKFNTRLKRRADVDFEKLKNGSSEYEMRLNQVKPEVKSNQLKNMLLDQGKRQKST